MQAEGNEFNCLFEKAQFSRDEMLAPMNCRSHTVPGLRSSTSSASPVNLRAHPELGHCVLIPSSPYSTAFFSSAHRPGRRLWMKVQGCERSQDCSLRINCHNGLMPYGRLRRGGPAKKSASPQVERRHFAPLTVGTGG